MKAQTPLNVDTSESSKLNRGEGLPIKIPMNVIRWLVYSACFFTLLIPFNHTIWQWICGALILGWFAGMLNAIINKK
jgi:hypothetical protein